MSGIDEELLLEEELKKALLLTEDEIEELLEKEVAESMSQDYANREKAFEVKTEIKDGIEKVYVNFNKARGDDAYEYLSDKEKEEYYLQHVGLIRYIASQFVCEHKKLFLDEIEGWATIGFVKALNSYKLSFAASFPTYASHCMKNEIKSQITHLKTQVEEAHSLDETIDSDLGKASIKDIIEADVDVSGDVERNIEQQAMKLVIQDLSTVLNPKEVFAIMSYYGFDDFTKRSQTEIGMILHISQVAVSLMLDNASKKLQSLYMEKFSEVSRNNL